MGLYSYHQNYKLPVCPVFRKGGKIYVIHLNDLYIFGEKVHDALIIELDLLKHTHWDQPRSMQRTLKFGYMEAINELDDLELAYNQINENFTSHQISLVQWLLEHPGKESVSTLVWHSERIEKLMLSQKAHYVKKPMYIRKNGAVRTDFDIVSALYLVYPEFVVEKNNKGACVVDYTELTGFFDNLLSILPGNVQVTLIVKNNTVYDRLNAKHQHFRIIINSDIQSIWIRDWGGFVCGKKLVKPIYKPRYYWGDIDIAKKINQDSRFLHSIMGKEMEDIPLIWDGGNLVTNGNVGFIIDRIVHDNKKVGREEIISQIRDQLKIEVEMLPECPKDQTAHADGYLAFVDEQNVFVSQYPETWYDAEREYVDRLADSLEKNGFVVHRLQEFPLEEKTKCDFQSARGLYVNFLKLNNTIIVPKYKHVDPALQEMNYQKLRTFGAVIPIDCDDLADYGGVLHCISLTN